MPPRLDDVTHLAAHEWHEPELRARIAICREEFMRCFDILSQHDLAIYLTMDYFSHTPAPHVRIVILELFVHQLLDRFLAEFPQIAGIIIRIGESDGRDVRDDFRRKLLFRTWTVGAYAIGYLMWHRRTFTRVNDGLGSDELVVSMKYGENDLFHYLPLHRNIFRTKVAKISESAMGVDAVFR